MVFSNLFLKCVFPDESKKDKSGVDIFADTDDMFSENYNVSS